MSDTEYDDDFDIEEEDDDLLIEDEDDIDDDEKLEEEGDIDNIDEDEFENSDDEDKEEVDKEDGNDDIDVIELEEHELKPETKRITVPFITKYEYPKIISIRAQQIANGSPIFLKNINEVKDKLPMNIAELEFKKGCLNNMIINRQLPNGRVERIKLSELKFYSFY